MGSIKSAFFHLNRSTRLINTNHHHHHEKQSVFDFVFFIVIKNSKLAGIAQTYMEFLLYKSWLHKQCPNNPTSDQLSVEITVENI